MRRLNSSDGLRLLFVAMMGMLAACSSIDCPLNNVVYCNYLLQGRVTTLDDTLTIWTKRLTVGDTILINQQVSTDSFSLPMSYGQEVDELYFQCNSLVDTVWVSKEDQPHFESVDCGVNYFHTLTGVSHTRHAIDSIIINHKEVTYDATPKHMYLYFKVYRY